MIASGATPHVDPGAEIDPINIARLEFAAGKLGLRAIRRFPDKSFVYIEGRAPAEVLA